MKPSAYLFFNGNCAEAIAAYADIFAGEIVMTMPASDMPAEFPVPEDRKNWIMHATLRIGDGELMASDDVMGNSAPMAGCAVIVSLPTRDAAYTAFNRLAKGGMIQMAFEPTFWSKGFGTLTDRFGIKWMIGTDEAA